MLPHDIESLGVTVHKRVEDAIEGADVIDVLRIQLERQKKGLFPSPREYARIFGLNEKRLALAKPDVTVLHPGPMNRGLEISWEVATAITPLFVMKCKWCSSTYGNSYS